MSRPIELDPGITRRDFINATAIGAGLGLLGACAPSQAPAATDPWTGFGGVGDYRLANGNTKSVMDAAHAIRDATFADRLQALPSSTERFDVVIVGGGLAGLGALHELRKRRADGRYLILENHPVFGGYAKTNAFDVAGIRLVTAQASMNFMQPSTAQERADAYFDDFRLPADFGFADREDGDRRITFPKATSSPLYVGEQSATTGYFFGPEAGGGWVTDIWNGDLDRAPWPSEMKRALLTLRERRRAGKPDEAEGRRLDAMSFAEFATRELGATPEALRYISNGMCITGPEVSAYGAQSLPNLERYAAGSAGAAAGDRFISFPGGNAVFAKHFVKAAWPNAIKGPATPEGVALGAIDASALDRDVDRCRMRLGATVLRVTHKGQPDAAVGLDIVYEQNGQLHRVESRAAVMTTGQWVSKHIIADLPDDRRAALDRHLFSPILIANIALTNWRFLDKLGFAAARWFDGFGFYASVRRPMVFGGRASPFHPDKPIVMTLYAPFPQPGLPIEAQGPSARATMFGTSYADYERQIVAQLRQLFSAGGFDARRDIAGIILNRWGHAFLTPPPGFFFGEKGGAAPAKLALERFGRIAFTQSADWLGSARSGKRAAEDVLAIL